VGKIAPSTFYTFDPQGNVCQRLNSAAAVTSTDVYDAFGKGYRSPSGINDTYGFGGQWGYYHDYDTPLGLHLLSNRYLDTQTGRFLTRDPIGYAGGGNLYRFVGNSPTSFADPSGLVERWQYVAGGAAVGGVGGAVIGAPAGPGGSAFAGGLLAYEGAQVGGSLYDSAEDFGFAWGCYEGGRAKLWQLLWSGTKGAFNAGTTVLFLRGLRTPSGMSGRKGGAASSMPNFDQARREAFERAGMADPANVSFKKVDPATGTVVEFAGPNGAKVAYDSPHAEEGFGHDMPHISWQSAGKRGRGGTRGNIPYWGPQHPFRSPNKGEGLLYGDDDD
jgi:RHS repeat-associated protein